MQAGLAVFSDQGFAATKLDDVAVKAGVAKGTIYLYFRDKQDLFEQIVRDAVLPVIARLEGIAQAPDLPAEVALKALIDLFRTEVLETRRKHVLRLIMTEGPRFPALAEFYHREVVSRGLKHIGELLRRIGGQRRAVNRRCRQISSAGVRTIADGRDVGRSLCADRPARRGWNARRAPRTAGR